MSMYRQLWLAIILSTLLALSGSLLASLLSARSYLEEQLSIKNSDNASALALALSQGQVDPTTVELTAAALFDSGHYELVRVNDAFGKTMVERLSQGDQSTAPAWFMRVLPLDAKVGSAQITSGWKQFGTVNLKSHSRFAYDALWSSSKEMFAAVLLAGFIGGFLGASILRRIKKPLDAVIRQATAISERRFVTIDEPAVPELKRLARAMNEAVVRLRTIFAEEAERLDMIRVEANNDYLTGLANRKYFMARLQQTLHSDRVINGSLLLVRIANLIELNKKLGRTATDDLIKQLSQVVKSNADSYEDGLAGRLNGADFAILLPNVLGKDAHANKLLENLVRVSAAFIGSDPTASIGICDFQHRMGIDTLMTSVDAALASAESAGENQIAFAISSASADAPISSTQWGQRIRDALLNHRAKLTTFPVKSFSGELLHLECPLRLQIEDGGEWLPAGRFLPIAERQNLTSQIDLTALELALQQLTAQPTIKGLAINLSATSLTVPDYGRAFKALLTRHNVAARRLWVEMAESGALRHLDAFRQFYREIKPSGCMLGIEHFGREFSQIGVLHDVGLDYVKVEASFIRNIESNPGNQAFLKGLSSIARNFGFKVIAEGVSSKSELESLRELDFDGATGPAIQE